MERPKVMVLNILAGTKFDEYHILQHVTRCHDQLMHRTMLRLIIFSLLHECACPRALKQAWPCKVRYNNDDDDAGRSLSAQDAAQIAPPLSAQNAETGSQP